MTDLKRVYAEPKEETALLELDLLEEKWKQKYPNLIKGFNRQMHKVTMNKSVFRIDDSLIYDRCYKEVDAKSSRLEQTAVFSIYRCKKLHLINISL